MAVSTSNRERPGRSVGLPTTRVAGTIADVLIVGGDGLIGRALTRHLRSEGLSVVATTRRPHGGGLPFDLVDGSRSRAALPVARTAIIAAGATSLAGCAADPRGTARINVDGTVALFEKLAAAGTAIVYLSSSQVFDGSLPYRRRDSAYCPVSEYGRQKAAAEAALLRCAPQAAIVRFAKVVAPSWGLLAGWRDALRAGRTIRPFADFTLAPIALEHAVGLVAAVLFSRSSGIFQASGDRDLGYVELANAVAGCIGVDRALIVPGRSDPAQAGFERMPRYSSFDMDLESKLFGIAPPSSREVIGDVAAAVCRGA
jgi:dTDP-4-dehydrorhamnose reductase